MSEGIFALLGLIVGSVGTFFNTWYKHNKEEEKEEKELKREKLEQVHTHLTKLKEDEIELLHDTYNLDPEKTMKDGFENYPRFKSYKQLKLLIDLYHQELKDDFKKLSSIIDSIRGHRVNYIKAQLNIQILEFEGAHTTDPKYFLEKYNKKIDELYDSIDTMQDRISKISSNL